MYAKSMWWVFLLAFGLTIGGIQSLGWWTKPFAPQAQVTQFDADASANTAAVEHSQGQPMHWRSLVMCQ
jgi:hypothetical protein